MIRKFAAVLALLLGAMGLFGVPSAAGGDSDYSDCVVTASPNDENDNDVVDAGETVDVSGTGFEPNFSSDILFDGSEDIGDVTTDATGSFGPVTVTIPADAEDGPHTISVRCGDGLTLASTQVQVGEVSRGDDGSLPTTGSDVEPLLVAAAIALLVGVTMVLVSRRRRQLRSAT